jgi:hypothetical protein
MLPDQPWLVKCPHCDTLVWIDEQKKVGKIDLWVDGQGVATFKDARPYVTPVSQDYLAALAEGFSDNQKVRYLRLRIWWAGNDERREEAGASSLSGREIDNLRAFAALLDESDEEDRVMKAEAMRELGEYEEALVLLKEPFRDELAQAARQIKDLASRKDPLVKEMKFE